jgi:hypothetical protein
VLIFGQGGTDRVTINGTPGSNTYTVNGLTVTLNSFTFTADHLAGWTLVGQGTSNLLNVTSILRGVPVSFFGGHGAVNTVAGPNTANTWTISAAGGGSLVTTPVSGRVTFKGVQDLIGGTGVNVFKFSPAGSVRSINGNGGSDWLDYSAFPSSSGVRVDLTQGEATGVNGGAANAVTGIWNVRGGAGNDTLIGNGGNILVCGGGNDTLISAYNGSSSNAAGRSLLIGGSGGDTLTAGTAGDILIGGTTTFDNNNAALASILAEWQLSDSYTLRYERLQGKAGVGTGANGKHNLIWGKTVLDDGTADTLNGGGSGAGMDWFFASYPGGTDTINNFDAPGDEHLNNRQ